MGRTFSTETKDLREEDPTDPTTDPTTEEPTDPTAKTATTISEI